MILPGIAPIGFLCPLISASSRRPQREMQTYSLPKASATDFPIEVLTPGGPVKQMIGDFMSLRNFKTYCQMLNHSFLNIF
jgi:hypothetical protein